jgi:hypothetical protein
MIRFLLFVALLWIGMERTAHAYVDPGTGSFILQAIVGLGLGAAFYFRRALSRIASLFRPKTDGQDSDPPR